MKLRVLAYCILGCLPMALMLLGGQFSWWWVSGIVLAAAFVPVALFGPPSVLGQFAVIAPLLAIVTSFCTWSEAWIFIPDFRRHGLRNLIGSLTTYLLLATVLAVLAKILKLAKPREYKPAHRGVAGTILMIAVCAMAYIVYYLVFGAITYQFFTKGYYPEAAAIAQSLGLWFWALQLARGALMTLAVLPAIYTLRMERWQAAITIGMLIWVAGGLAPLLAANPFMGTTQRIIHIVEILLQNGSLGITAALLLRPRAARVPSVSTQTA